MREEAKLQKELEEARKDIEKEQKHYSNALSKINEQLEKCDDVEKDVLLEKKAEIESHLSSLDKAMEDIDYRQANKRAGYVYIISNIGSFGENVYKIGMVNDCDTIRAIAETLKKYQESFQHLVIDPVMVSTSGCRLMQEDALDVFNTELLPLATLLTPNIPEAEILANRKIENAEDIKAAAAAICKLGCRYVLIKGGHFDGAEKVDYLFEDGKREIKTYRCSNSRVK
jgi:hypothetical protein